MALLLRAIWPGIPDVYRGNTKAHLLSNSAFYLVTFLFSRVEPRTAQVFSTIDYIMRTLMPN